MDDKQDTAQSQDAQEFKPGDTVSPAATVVSNPQPVASQQPEPITPAEAKIVEPETTQSTIPETPTPSAQPSFYSPESAPLPTVATDEPLVQWTAAEFIAQEKSTKWYLGIFGAAVLIAFVVFVLTKDKISTAVVLVAGIALGGYGGRKPQPLNYALFQDGLAIGRKVFDYDQFRSYSLEEEGAATSLSLVPHRRFGQLITLYFDPRDEPLILNVISSRLPLERRSKDLVDGLMKKIHF